MEDQRNWSDASFKTYSRPLALPFPYPVAAGEVLQDGRASRAIATDAAAARRRRDRIDLARRGRSPRSSSAPRRRPIRRPRPRRPSATASCWSSSTSATPNWRAALERAARAECRWMCGSSRIPASDLARRRRRARAACRSCAYRHLDRARLVTLPRRATTLRAALARSRRSPPRDRRRAVALHRVQPRAPPHPRRPRRPRRSR